MKALLDLFKQTQGEEQFDVIKIGLASPKKFVRGLLAKYANQKQLTIALLNLSVMVYFAPRFLAQLKTMSAYVANTNV